MLTPLAVAAVLAAAPVQGLDTPEFTRTWRGAPSEGIEGKRARVTCHAYERFSVVEENDPGLRGAKSIVVRDRPPGMLAARACAEFFHTPARTLELSDVYVEGARGPWVVLRSSDSAAGAMELKLVEAATGKVVYEAARFVGASPRFVASKKRVALDLHVELTGACAAVGGCDREALTQAGVPATLKLQLDLSGCKGAGPDDVPHIYVPARVDDLEQPAATWQPGTAYCALSE